MTNSITLRGELIEELTSKKVIEKKFILAVSRNSGVIDRILINMTLSQAEFLDIQVGNRVQVDGTVISYHEDNHLQIAVRVDFIMKIDNDSSLKDMNEFKLSGNICRQPVHRFTKKDREITHFMIASKAEYIPVVAFFQNAAYLKDCPIGHELEVAGRLQSRHYIKSDPDTGEVLENREYMELAIKEVLGVDVEAG